MQSEDGDGVMVPKQFLAQLEGLEEQMHEQTGNFLYSFVPICFLIQI